MQASAAAAPIPATRHFLAGGGEMGARMRAHDWSTSPLGPPEHWPQALRTLVRLMLSAKQAMFVAWGPQLAFLYNDDYAPIFGNKHPHALGRAFAEVWADIWPQIQPLVTRTLSGEASWHEDLLIPMERHGYREEAHFSFSYTPVYDDEGAVAGLFCAAIETTRKVEAERHLARESDRMRELFQQAPGFMVVFRGPEHCFELVNDSYYQLVGHRDTLGKPLLEALPEVAGQGFDELLDRVYTTGEPFVGRGIPVLLQRNPQSEPEQRYVDFVYQPIRGPDGRVTGIFAEGSDVTEARRAEEALRDSEHRLRLALDAGRMATWEHDSATETITATAELKRLLGYDEDFELDVPKIRAGYYPGSREILANAAMDALKRGERFFEAEYRYYRADGALRWYLMRAEMEVNDAGMPTRTVGVILDITSRKKTEDDLREREADLKAALDAGSLAIFDYDHARKVLGPSPGLAELYGYPPDHALTIEDIRARYHPDDAAQIYTKRDTEEEDPSRELFDWTLRLLLPDGRVRWVNGRGEYLRDGEGRPARARGVVMDVTERKRWEEHQKLLINELNHRVKNTLATVQSIASQSLRNAATADEARSTMEERLFALSRAHDVLTRENWEGAGLREIVTEAVSPYRHAREERFRIAGPDTRLSPRMALAIAMALQELATNAVKYGALSNDTGQVAVEWSLKGSGDEEVLCLAWRESGGPPVTAPERRGFGTRLIERSLAQDLNGEVRIDFAPSGVVCTLEAPLTREEALA